MTADVYNTAPKPVVLHIGDPILYDEALYARFCELYTVIRPSTEERQRPEFIKALKENRWGDFNAIFRPYWSTGGEMGKWDAELISCLPQSVRVFASAGAGYDWANVDELANHGMLSFSRGAAANSHCLTPQRHNILQLGCCLHRVCSRLRPLWHPVHLPPAAVVHLSSQ